MHRFNGHCNRGVCADGLLDEAPPCSCCCAGCRSARATARRCADRAASPEWRRFWRSLAADPAMQK